MRGRFPALAADNPPNCIACPDFKPETVRVVFLASNCTGPYDPDFTGPETAFENKGILPDNARIARSPAGVVDAHRDRVRDAWFNDGRCGNASCAKGAKQGENS